MDQRSLSCSVTSSLVDDPTVFPAQRGAVRQQTVGVVPKVDISGSCESVGVVRLHTGTPGPLLCASRALVQAPHRLFVRCALLLTVAQLWVAESPDHAAEVEEEGPHHQDHERVGLHHGFSHGGRHCLSAQGQQALPLELLISSPPAGGTCVISASRLSNVRMTAWIGTVAVVAALVLNRTVPVPAVNECNPRFCCDLGKLCVHKISAANSQECTCLLQTRQ